MRVRWPALVDVELYDEVVTPPVDSGDEPRLDLLERGRRDEEEPSSWLPISSSEFLAELVVD